MHCSNCGNRVNPDDVYCAVCGAHISQVRDAVARDKAFAYRAAYNSQPPRKRESKKGNNWVIILSAIVAALVVVGFALYLGLNHQDEQSLWEKCVRDKELTDVNDYIKEFPNGEHINEARQLYDMLFNEKTDWDNAMASDDEDQWRAFIKNYPSGKLVNQAKEKLDDVVWNKAFGQNNKEALRRYLNEFPNGRHVAEARSQFSKLQRAELTFEESENVKNIIHQFLDDMAQCNPDAMIMMCSFPMDNFMTKRQASQGDVDDYVRAFRESDIESIWFTSVVVGNVNKTMKNDDTPEYTATFTATRYFQRQYVEKGTVAQMSGKAVLDRDFRFREFAMDKVSEQ